LAGFGVAPVAAITALGDLQEGRVLAESLYQRGWLGLRMTEGQPGLATLAGSGMWVF